MSRNIIAVFIACVSLTGILVAINRPDSSVFLPYFVLQGIAFLVMLLCTFLLRRFTARLSDWVLYILSFLVAYATLMLVVWKINGANIFEFVGKYHTGKDFFGMVFPFIVTNVLMLIWLTSKK